MTDEQPQRRDDLTIQRSGDEARLTDPTTGEAHVLNASAFAIWELCDGMTEATTMAEAVAEVTPMDLDEAREQILHTIQLLREKGLVE